MVLRGQRVVISEALRLQMLMTLHNGHQGIMKMQSQAGETVYWPGIDADIANYV